jgi:hypothetical protein
MLYDWESYDCDSSSLLPACVPNTKVKDIVAADLQQLKGKVNFIHLYLWDQDILQGDPLVGENLDAPGFKGWDNGGPEGSPHSQWNALKEFVQKAKANDMWVHLEFAVSRPNKLVAQGGGTPGAGTAVGTAYAGWVKKFFDLVKEYQNVLIWGLDYGIIKPNNATGQAFWNAAYPSLLAHLQANPYSSPGVSGRALLSVESYFGMTIGDVAPFLDGHRWNWQDAQRMAFFWNQVSPNAPDLYAFQMWNAHVGDLEANLECVAGTINAAVCSLSATCGSECSPIPFSKMVVTEYGTGTSFEGPPIGNRTASYGDAYTPIFNLAGQQSWLNTTLCLFARRAIPAHAYFGLYDSASFWERDYNSTGADLAWLGYWGLSSELQSYGDNGKKLSWSTFFDFNPNACPASNIPATPALALLADADYYTVGDSGKLTYAAANVTELSLNEPPPDPLRKSYSCTSGLQISQDALTGSCAYTMSTMANTGTITLTGTNTNVKGSRQGTASSGTATTVTVGLAPNVTGLVNATTSASCDVQANPSCTLVASQGDTLEVFGKGFSLTGGNLLELSNQSGSDWLYQGDGYYFWDGSRTQINAQVKCSVTPGAWTLYAKSPTSGTRSNGAAILITANGNCN